MATEVVRFSGDARGLAKMHSGPVSPVMGQFGGRLYPEKSDPNCRICRCRERGSIDNALADQVAIRSIWEWLPDESDLKQIEYKNFYRSVRRHSNKHTGLALALARQEAERHAVALNVDLEKVQGYLVDHMLVLDTVMAKGLQRIAAGNEIVDAATTVRAARAKAAIVQAMASQVDDETITEAFSAFLRIAKGLMSEEAFGEMAVQLRQDTVLLALADRVRRQQEHVDPRTVELES